MDRVGRHLEDTATVEVDLGGGKLDNRQGEMVPGEILGHCQKEEIPQGMKTSLWRAWILGNIGLIEEVSLWSAGRPPK